MGAGGWSRTAQATLLEEILPRMPLPPCATSTNITASAVRHSTTGIGTDGLAACKRPHGDVEFVSAFPRASEGVGLAKDGRALCGTVRQVQRVSKRGRRETQTTLTNVQKNLRPSSAVRALRIRVRCACATGQLWTA